VEPQRQGQHGPGAGRTGQDRRQRGGGPQGALHDASQDRQRRPAGQPHHAQHGAPDGDGHANEQAHAQPMIRRSPESRAAKESHDKLLAVKPGQQVYVVPFHKRATLIRINMEKEQAVVQSGIFELELPLADLEPVRD